MTSEVSLQQVSLSRLLDAAQSASLSETLSQLEQASNEASEQDASILRAVRSALAHDMVLLQSHPRALASCLFLRTQGTVPESVLASWKEQANALSLSWFEASRQHKAHAALMAECRGVALPTVPSLQFADNQTVEIAGASERLRWDVAQGKVSRDASVPAAQPEVMLDTDRAVVVQVQGSDVARYTVPEGVRVNGWACTRDGSSIALYGLRDEGTISVVLWFSPSHTTPLEWTTGHVHSLRLSEDERSVVVASSRGVEWLDIASVGHVTWAVPATAAAVSPDGTRVVTLASGVVSVWLCAQLNDAATLRDTRVAPAYSPDGTWCVSANEIRRADSERSVAMLPEAEMRPATQFVGNRFIVRLQHGLKVWESATGRLVRESKLVKLPARALVSWHPDGRLLATVPGWNGALPGSRGGHIEILDVLHEQVLRSFGDPRPSVEAILFSPDAEHLAVIRVGGRLEMWEVHSGALLWSRPVYSDPAELTALRFSDDGEQIVTGAHDTPVCVWSVDDGTLLASRTLREMDPTESVQDEDGERTVRCWHATPEAMHALASWTPFCFESTVRSSWSVRSEHGISTFVSRANQTLVVVPDEGPWAEHPSENKWISDRLTLRETPRR